MFGENDGEMERQRIKRCRGRCNPTLWINFQSLVILLRANLLIITATQMPRSQRTAHKRISTPPFASHFSAADTHTHRLTHCAFHKCSHTHTHTHTLKNINTKPQVCYSLLPSSSKSLSFPPHLSCFFERRVVMSCFIREEGQGSPGAVSLK